MEEWEREHIRKHLPELTKLTTFRQSLLDKLRAKGVFGDEDVDQLKRDGIADYQRISDLYVMLKTRDKGFEALACSLLSDGQTGAYRILQQGQLNHAGKLPNELAATPLFRTNLAEIEELLDDDTINILIVSTPDLQLSLKRIADVGKDYLIVHNDEKTRLSKRKLQSMDEETALVVTCEKIEIILKRLEGSSTNVVMITRESTEQLEKVIEAHQQNIKIVNEEIHWSHLTPEGQKMILQQNVTFQGQVLQLEKIPLEILPTEQIKGPLVFDLLKGMCPELVRNSIPLSPNYYVPRKILSRVNISPEVFRKASGDVFVVDGHELYQLTNLTSKRDDGGAVPVARSSEQLKKLTAQFIQLEHANDYEDICALTKNPVHWISHRSGEYIWRKSHGSLGCIPKYIQETQGYVEDEDDFVRACLTFERPICVADSPGMGKTLLLTRIAEKVMMSESSSEKCVVRFLTLRDLIPSIQHQPHIDMDDACELIAKSASDYDLGKQIVIKALKTEKIRCHVFLDGYDELLRNQITTCNKILACIRQLKNTQVYVTTRLNRCHELEEALVTTGFHIRPFQVEDQVAFLAGYWNQTADLKNDKVKEFAKSCLGTLKENMSETERDIAGIPLQCRLLAEVHAKEAKGYSEGRSELAFKEIGSITLTLFGMFKAFIDMSFGKVEAGVKERVRLAHMYYAIKLLFPDIEKQFKRSFPEEDLTPEDSILLAPGILEKTEHEDYPRFIHRTLAEYFLAHFVITFLETSPDSPAGKFLTTVLRKVLSTNERGDIVLRKSYTFDPLLIQSQTFEFCVICYFVNSLMSESATLETVGRPYSAISTFPGPELIKVFSATVKGNFPAIGSFVTKFTNFKTDSLSWSNLFLLAAKYAETELMCQIITLAKLQKQVQISDAKYPAARLLNDEQFDVTPLHVAEHWGNYNVTILLINNYGFRDLIFQGFIKLKYLLHTCVLQSYEDSEKVVINKIEIIKWLCSRKEASEPPNPYRHILEEVSPDRRTPLLQYHVHPKVIECLIEVGVNTNAISEYNQCVLHTVVESRFTPTQYHQLVNSLMQTTFKYYNLKDKFGDTPLRIAIRDLDIEVRTVDLFLKKEANINQISRTGRSILFEALHRGRAKEFVTALAARGADLIYEMTFVVPAKVMEAVEYVIETSPYLLNTYFSKMSNSDDCDDDQNRPPIINASVKLREMENHQLSSYLLSTSNPSSSLTRTTAEPCFVVHSLMSYIIARKNLRSDDSWGLAFNYNKLQKNNVFGGVRECTAKVVLFSQELIDEIEKLLEQKGMYPIVAVEGAQLTDLPSRAQHLIWNQKFAVVQGGPDNFDNTRNRKLSSESIKGKLLFDLTIEHQLTLVNRGKFNNNSYIKILNANLSANINNYKMSSRRDISTSIFQTLDNDVFVVEGLGLLQLQTFIDDGILVDKSSNQTSVLTARWIQLESAEDFPKICSLSEFPVHWLSHQEGNLRLVKSRGSLACIQEHIHEQQQQLTLAEFVEEIIRESSPICLAYGGYNERILVRLIIALKKQIHRNPTSVVFCLQLESEFLKEVIKYVTPATAVQFIADKLSDYALGREYVTDCLQSDKLSCYLLFYQDYFSPTRQNLSTLAEALRYIKLLQNVKLRFIVDTGTLSGMEEALQTLGFKFLTKTEDTN